MTSPQPIFYDEIRRIGANPTLTDEDIRLAWEAYLVGVPAERLACLRRVKQNYRTAVLSNTNPIHWAQAERDYFGTEGYTVADYFDTLFLSCDMHVQKPRSGHFRPRHGGTGLRTGRDSILR